MPVANPHQHPPSAIEEALDVLRQHGHRITAPRRAILHALIGRGEPGTIEQLHQAVGTDGCDLVTVYRCMDAFEKLGLVRRSYYESGTCLYEYQPPGAKEHHHHIICRSCQRVETLDLCVVEGLEKLVRDRGYHKVSHLLEFFGTCPDCFAAEQERS
ncbi:MAG: transcriptional repressor [Puniceicoccaceae bacterium]|nr:MAG: transcriptional repressor [Puniceicoccaceae bacterium]